ncbi:acetyl-CoA carboxylase biotin carboxylase subunit [Thalassotalea agarivorans]|uniref:Biotin carboxylase n=1 Tax=Thalassotalea agarivorans TaxID=349064 RepID=A0A1I0HZK0_THASX|nr:acetyl/propionyl/methylcrotonyl-CoA carboxylase subunit alpha [Thalassotalea agarivorans]SET89772.1 3-methylcrotonyl-CoA carboxylase alpha subunit [Thalassotalea agarivorans]
MFKKILIANRGEIACRVIKTARKMGIQTVAVYSDADANALHVKLADEAIHIGESPATKSYLLGDKIIAAAQKTGAEAIHPGYGFLSENADFCRACEKAGVVFIGPNVKAIETMGSKSAAKQAMEQANVPLVPGYHGLNQGPSRLKNEASDIGYPVLLKAVAGGGGKGMRVVNQESEFQDALDAAKRESKAAFGDDAMLIEKYLTQPRHVEIQVFCDTLGNAVYLFERDCSLQRRHQKVIEEAPAPNMSLSLRQKMGEAAVACARTIGYVGAGTVEFLLDKDDSFYFMEMNTRLQVEHPVTELITGQDLVQWQLLVANGQPLPMQQEQLTIKGHAFEARIYAEDAENNFLPSTGTLSYLLAPEESEHVRVDTGVEQGDEISMYYDPMIAKLIVWDQNRDAALGRLAQALKKYRVRGVKTNIDFLYNLAICPPFVEADLDTNFIEKHADLIFKKQNITLSDEVAIAAFIFYHKLTQQAQSTVSNSEDVHSPWHNLNSFRLNLAASQLLSLTFQDTKIQCILTNNAGNLSVDVNGEIFDITGEVVGDQVNLIVNTQHKQMNFAFDGNDLELFTEEGALHFQYYDGSQVEAEQQQDASLAAPMNGTVVKVLVAEGDTVEKDAPLMVMEAMKMEHTVKAPKAGKVTNVYFKDGDMVDGGAVLLALEE